VLFRSQGLRTARTGILGAIEDIWGSLLGEGLNDIQFAADMVNRGLLCDSTSLPSRGITTMPQTMYGFAENFPVQSEYIPIQCTFLLPMFGAVNPFFNSLENAVVNAVLPDSIQVRIGNPATNPLPMFFAMWQNVIQDASNGVDSGFNFSFPGDYYTTMQLIMFDKQDNASLIYILDRVYPETVTPPAVSWDGTDFAKLTVSFRYSTFRLVKPNPSKLSITVDTPIGGGTITF
jgi:hypothetical protein